MERSSPLASLQPIHPGFFPRRMDYASDLLRPHQNEPSHFNFRDMSMMKSNSDYFGFNPVRGSSPTASLAADLSQNFHIDRTPQLATPRRNLFNNAIISPLNGQRGVVTPPIPSSSPAPDSSTMELSPLPHKAPFAPDLPTYVPTPSEDTHMAPPPPPSASIPSSLLRPPQRPQSNHARRISFGSRPSLRRNHSTNAVDSKPSSTQTALGAPFSFGLCTSRPPPPILESFADSPPSERKPAPVAAIPSLIGPPLPKLNFQDNGSPIGPVRRASSARGGAPRIGLGRRTQSLQYSDPTRPMMRQDKRSCTDGSYQPSVNLHEARTLKLPHFKPDEEIDALPRITKDTLIGVMSGSHADEIASATIIDCRFEYEFEGGHIDGAVNYNDKEDLANKLFSQLQSTEASSNTALVFHCEYSNHRAPLMAKFIRQRDRTINQHHYPRLTYPDIYILDGGYSEFFRDHRCRCFPQSYVEMESKEHEDACERGMAKVKRRAKLSRAQTYAFGQNYIAPGPASAPLAPSLSSISIPEVPPLPAGPFSNPMPSMPFGSQPTVLHGVDSMAMDIDVPARPVTFDSPGVKSWWPRRKDSY